MMKRFITTVITLFIALVCTISQAEEKPSYEVLFKFLGNDPSGNFFNAEITLTNSSAKEINDWKLCLDFVRPFEIDKKSAEKVELTKVIGEYCEIKGLCPIASKESLTFSIVGKWFIKKYTDTPSIYFLVIDGKNIKSVAGSTDLGGYQPPKYESNLQPIDNSFQNPIRLIPAPSDVQKTNGTLDFAKVKQIVDSTKTEDVKKTVKDFLKNYKKLINKSFAIRNKKDNKNEFISITNNKELSKDSYILKITKNGAEIQSNSKGGYLYGLISLFKLASAYDNNIPCMNITDAPRFAYRGSLLDVARNFKSVSEVKDYLRMMALYKLNVFHWHLTDDEGWRIQINKYPNLTNIGAWRGYNELIPPFNGSSYKKTGGFYTQKDIENIIRFANDLNITIIPEIDIPGHARALIVSFNNYKNGENPLVEKDDKSDYTTPQNFHDDALNPGLKSTYEILDGIFSEVLPLFAVQKELKMPYSNYVHIGSDEVPSGAWLGSPSCKEIMKEKKLEKTQELQHYFVTKVKDIVAKYGYNVAGWEEVVGGGEFPSKDILVMSWQGEEAGFKAAEKGFPVIMAPAQYLYFDLSYSNDVKEPGYYWAGYVNPKTIYSYEPIPTSSSDNIKKNIVGVEGCLWGDSLVKPRVVNADILPANFIASPVQYMAFPKMTAFSEVAWTSAANRRWHNFVTNYIYEQKILNEFDIKYRKASIE
ncbi:MAG TPA: hypothetical protein DD381_06735 [Lentisphaeria bacterium]|nr:MAG: hypothetical protein A2X47_13050 [Lentisphaerae bacterium GWF2_38_69]HBM16019.1 hypothetical protein [Lentisphaeria bacterium]